MDEKDMNTPENEPVNNDSNEESVKKDETASADVYWKTPDSPVSQQENVPTVDDSQAQYQSNQQYAQYQTYQQPQNPQQPQNQQYQTYQQPVQNQQYQPYVQQPVKKKHTMAITGMIFGIVACAMSCSVIISAALAVVALVLGIVAKSNDDHSGYATASIILGVVGIALSIVFGILVFGTAITVFRDIINNGDWNDYEYYIEEFENNLTNMSSLFVGK